MIQLNSYSFDPDFTSVEEKLEDVGGADMRRFRISGLIVGKSSLADIQSELDRILDEASIAGQGATLSLRSGRQYHLERAKFERQIMEAELMGGFVLDLWAEDPFEYSTAETTSSWNIAASGSTKSVAAAGNVYSQPRLVLTATGNVINPNISDGTRTINYSGTVTDDQVLTFDAVAEAVALDGEDVTPYSSGEFPRIEPEGTTLTYTDDPSSSHTCGVEIVFRDRWW